MGLPISQNLCQMMGGVISVKSKVGVGSTFRFVLPLNASEVMITSRAGVEDSHRQKNDKQFDSHCTQKTLEFASMLEHALSKEASLPVSDLSGNDLHLKLKHSNFSHLTRGSGTRLHQSKDRSPSARLQVAPKRAKDQDEITDQQSQEDAQNQRLNSLGGGSGDAGPQGSIHGSGNLDGNQHIQPRQKKSRDVIDEDDDEMAD